MNAEKDKRHTLYKEKIKDAIQEAILTGKLGQGDRVVETQWARNLGVSQSPVRDALRELESMGMIEIIPYKGAFVKKVSTKEILDSYRVRLSLERLAAEEASTKINQKALKQMKTLLDKMQEAGDNKNFNDYIQYNTDFHRVIMEASDNGLLLRLWDQCNFHDWTYVDTYYSDKELRLLAKRHEGLYQALVSHDTERAIRETEKHIGELMDALDN